ncbi:hypothetical protein DYB32_003038 [Aphanomyces invadans]|uniref:Uncharacterized protein n=1 Tax=Aphanomyces invadans TaxID=157072 RepID=A0A418B1K4_9STRA|nr:hypothetical protein DYB32_003038 [Aphanomyces invadans]
MHMTHSSDLILLRALVDRLRQDYVVVELMSRLFSKQHKCALDTPPNEYSWDKDNLTSLDLLALMTRLLKQCAEVDNENVWLYGVSESTSLTSHLFSAWSSSYCTTCISNTLGPYLECLFGEALSLLRKVHKGLLKGNDLSKLQPSFFHVLVPLAIECIEVTHLRSNIKVGKALLPLLLPILKLLDEVTYKISEDSKVNNQILPDIEWITESNSQWTVSLAQVITALSERIPHWHTTSPAGISLKLVGLSILHDSLCKLTSNQAKCEMLRVFVEPVETPGGCLSLHFNSWQEPKVLERDMHTQFGISYHNKLTKAFENLYIRLAKMVASPSSSLLLKKRALNMWCISFHDASLLRNSAILHTLGELLQHEANIQQMSHRDMATDDAISCSAHGVPPSLTLPPRLRPVEKLVHMATAGYNVHQACWHVFSWLCKQFMANDDHRAVLNELRPSASSKALACASPRKRLSLPPKLIVSTLEESIDHMYLVLLQEMTKTKDALVAWNSHASQMAPCLQASQVMLLADPHVVSSVSTMFMATYKQRAPELGWTVCMWVHIEEYSNVPLVLVANGDVPLVQMTITVEEHGHISSLAAAGPLLFRIKQRQILDQYCTSLLSLLTWLAVVKAPAMTDEIHLMLTLLPLCPPPAHPHMFQLLSCVLPSIAPTLEIPSLSETLLAFLVKQFGIAWFSAQNNLYGPPELYQLLTSRKDNCISSLVRAGHLSKDGVASWIVSDCPIKAKSTSILRSMRASLLDSFVTLFRSLLTSSTWVPELLQLFSIESPEKVLLSCRADSSLLSNNRERVVQVILSIYVLGGYMKTTPPPIKMGESMMQLLEWVLQHPASVDGHVGSLDDMDQDVQIATYMHVRVSLLRLLTAQTPTPTVAGALLQLPIVVTELLSTAIRPFKASLEGVFGNEFDVVSKLDNVRGLMDWITDDSNESMSKKRVILDVRAYLVIVSA